MTAEREGRVGETIKLRARFQDDLGDNIEAGNVFIHVYIPSVETFDPANALLVSGIPTFLGQGIFEFDYPIPSNAPAGTWHDEWEGNLELQTVSGVLTFTVIDGGIVVPLEAQLFQNNVVEVTLTSGIQATDGSSLDEEFKFEFMTEINPAHTSVRKIRLEIGAFVQDLFDDTLQTANLEASIEADLLTFLKSTQNVPLYQHARREYVTCAASSILLNNIQQNILRSKTLGDLHVEYDSKGLTMAMNRSMDCMDKWEPQLLAAGLAKASRNPKMVVKGEKDPDRPIQSRMWQSTDDGGLTRRIPAANTRLKVVGGRRHLRTFRKKWW